MDLTQEQTRLAENAAACLPQMPDRPLKDDEIAKLADVVLEFSQQMCGVDLFPYQYEFAWRVAYSVLSEDAEEVTALFCRQCIPADQFVLMADGGYRPIENIRPGDRVLSMNMGTYDLEEDTVVDQWSVGEKERLSITTTRGYEIECSPKHLLATPQGWREAGSLVTNIDRKKSRVGKKGGRRITLGGETYYKRQLSFCGSISRGVFGTSDLTEDEAILLGYLISDGCYSKGSVKFTNTRTEYCAEVRAVISRLFPGVNIREYEKGKGVDYVFTTPGHRTGSNPVIQWLRELGIFGQKAGTKRLPDKLLRSSKACLALFLNRYFSGDGWVNSRGNYREMGLVFASKELAKEFQIILNKFGVGFPLSRETNPKTGNDIWKLRTCKGRVQRSLLGDIGPIFGKEKQSRGALELDKRTRGQDVFLDNDVSWDTICSIGKLSPVEMFDLSTSRNHNFICENFVVHNSGKTEAAAVVVCGLAVLLPVFARHLPSEPRATKFLGGLWVGIYAPGYDQAGIMWNRMRSRMYSPSSRAMLLDPDIDIDLAANRSRNLVLPNGSHIDCSTAAPQANIEGKTYHLVLFDECQDISSSVIKSSIHPMTTAVAGSLVKIGTCNRKKSEYYHACRRNKRSDVRGGRARSKFRNHFEFDYTVAQRYNPRYKKACEQEKQRLGEDSDDFRMKYRLHWLLDRGMYVNPDLFEECGIKGEGQNLTITRGKGKSVRKIVFVRSANAVTRDPKTKNQIAAIDVGRANSTVVTVGKVFWDCPVDFGGTTRYPVHVQNWLELQGDDHEAQHPQILAFLKNYQLSDVVVDATGKGDPIYSRLAADLDEYDIAVHPFIFSASSKDIGYKVLHQEIAERRLTYPAGAAASRLIKWQKFYGQMCDLEKEWRGQILVVHKPKDINARDDFPDSLMLLCWVANVRGTMEIEEADNFLLGRAARWAQSDMLKTAGAWWKKKLGPREKMTRPSHRGRWD